MRSVAVMLAIACGPTLQVATDASKAQAPQSDEAAAAQTDLGWNPVSPSAAAPLDFADLDFDPPVVEGAKCVALVSAIAPNSPARPVALEYRTAAGHHIAGVHLGPSGRMRISHGGPVEKSWHKSAPTNDGSVTHRKYSGVFEGLIERRIEHLKGGNFVRVDHTIYAHPSSRRRPRGMSSTITYLPDGRARAFRKDEDLDGAWDSGWETTFENGREQRTDSFKNGKLTSRVESTWSDDGRVRRTVVTFAEGGIQEQGTKSVYHYDDQERIIYEQINRVGNGPAYVGTTEWDGDVRSTKRGLVGQSQSYYRSNGDGIILHGEQDPDGDGPMPSVLTHKAVVGPVGRTFLWVGSVQGPTMVSTWVPGEDRFERHTKYTFANQYEYVTEQDWVDEHRVQEWRKYVNGEWYNTNHWTWRCGDEISD